MKKFKWVLFLFLFIIVITCLRLGWHTFYPQNKEIQFDSGILELDKENFPVDQSISLSGKWVFYPNSLLSPEEINNSPSFPNKEYREFPKGWNKFLDGDSYKYGTFHLKIKLSENIDENVYGIRMIKIPSASRLYINGKLVGHSGIPSVNEHKYTAQRVPYSTTFSPEDHEIDIVIHVAHGGYNLRSTEGDFIEFGSNRVIAKSNTLSIFSQLFVVVVLIILAIYSCLLFIVNNNKKVLVYFTLLLLSACLLILLDFDKLLLHIIPLNYQQSTKLVYATITCIMLFLTLFFKYLIPTYSSTKSTIFFLIISLCNILFIVVVPFSIFREWLFTQLFFSVFPTMFIARQLITAMSNQLKDSIFLLLSTVSIMNNILWGLLYHRTEIRHIFYPGDLILAIFFFSVFWLIQFFRNVHQVEILSHELLLSDKRKDDFLATTSHELRSPLHSIINIAHSIINNKKNVLEKRDKKDLELLLTVGKRMSYMINDLLDLARIKENRLRIQRKQTNLSSAVIITIQMMDYMVRDTGVKIINDVPNSIPDLYVDESRLTQILVNLLHNAIKYTRKGTITISAEKTIDNFIIIKIADTGIGIDQDSLERIFQPYHQSEDIGGNGIGLGLTITKKLIELHGGKINAKSSIGKGTTITFTLPVFIKQSGSNPLEIGDNLDFHIEDTSFQVHDIETANVYSDKSFTKNNNKKTKVLLVDDESINLHVLSRILLDDSYELTKKTSAKEALQLVKSRQWDLVISDVMMPEMTGFELTKEIRAIYDVFELPILLLTAKSTPEEVKKGFWSGANDYIIKPVDPIELKARVNVLTEWKQAVMDRLSMEAAWLHAQIKPHFIFNTLNSILYLVEEDKEKMAFALEQFTDYVQTTFDFKNTDHYVPLSKELRLVKAYVEIEKIRFNNRLTVVWDVNYESNAFIPPLTIQTLVENAIHHGLVVRNSPGVLTLKINEIGNKIHIMIKDNGVGMSEEKMEEILTRNDKKSVGIYNTNQRLKQLFNVDLNIDSNKTEGTTITFQLPSRINSAI
ncbi:ATP-binding protein [Virgibacillus salarius]